MLQAYLAAGGTVAGLVDDAELDWRTDAIRFALDNLLDALAPTNFPLTNPQVLKETIDSGGENLVTGALRFAGDAARGRCRRWSTRAASRSAATSASRPGAVVLHTDVFELIHYRPTDRARSTRRRCWSCRRRSTSSTSWTWRPDGA